MAAIKTTIKWWLQRLAPGLAERIITHRRRRHIERFERRVGVDRLARAFIQRHGLIVQAGPFKGLKYIPQAAGSAILPKLIGSYEEELIPVIERIIAWPYERIIDIGCAEGYYAVGLAKRLPAAVVYAFDIDPIARSRCQELARLNGVVDRVHMRGRCDNDTLQQTIAGKTLVICDCEGYEQVLLDPTRTPALKQADVLVELHDGFVPGVTQLLLERFAATHNAQLISVAARNPAGRAVLADLSPADQALALNEFRGGRPQQWAFLAALT